MRPKALRGNGYLASWEVGLMMWGGMTHSCAAMTSLTNFVDREVFTALDLNLAP
jgi:hypothetical protein